MNRKLQTVTGKAPKSRRNGVAAALALACFQQRKVRPRAGRGSYSRKQLARPDQCGA